MKAAEEEGGLIFLLHRHSKQIFPSLGKVATCPLGKIAVHTPAALD